MATSASKLRSMLTTKTPAAIKKSKHNQKKKPYSDVMVGVKDAQVVNDFMADFSPTSRTNRMIKWDLGAEDVYDLLPDLPEYIAGVKFDGKVWAMAGQKVYMAAEASCAMIESCEIKYKPVEGMIALKFRSVWVGRAGGPRPSWSLSAW